MSGGNAELEAMRRIVARTGRSPFEVFGGQTDVYSHIFALTGPRHVMLRRVSKEMRAAMRGAGKQTAVEYLVDRATFNAATARDKLQVLLQDLAATCEQFDVRSIEMIGLHRAIAHVAPELPLAPMLRNCPGLTSLNLASNEFRDIRAIDAALAGCTGLTRLELSGNPLHFWEDTFNGLTQCKALRELSLRGCGLGDTDFDVLTNTVDHLPALATLDLGDNGGPGHPDDAEYLVEQLAQYCTGLTRLSLRANNMDADTVQGLCVALPRLAALTHLDLSGNNMRSRGLNYLGQVLGGCTSLESLDVGSNHIETPWAALTSPFTDALPLCPRLRRLDLSGNRVGVHLWAALVQVLPRCRALERLELRACDVTEAMAALLAPELAACRALRELDLLANLALTAAAAAALRTAWAGGGRGGGGGGGGPAERLRLPAAWATDEGTRRG
jgi:hypothetical protein